MFDEMLNGYRLENEIGQGDYFKVFLATKLDTKEKFAIKKIQRDLLNNKGIKKYINNEIFILGKIKNDHIIKFYELKKDMNYIYLIFEFCNGGDLEVCLDKYITKYKRSFNEEIVQHLMKQIISGFVYLHSRRILHRNIKLNNILVKFPTKEDKEQLNMLKSEIKISGFYFSRYLKKRDLAKSIVGTPINMDPYIIRRMEKVDRDNNFGYDQKADIWSLGTITYELFVGWSPFESNSYKELLEKLEKGIYTIPNKIILSKESICFLNSMLQYDSQRRLKIEELTKQLFLNKDVKTFHHINFHKLKTYLTQSTQSIILNSKDEKKSNIFYILSCFNSSINNSDYESQKTLDNNLILNSGETEEIKKEK